MRSKHLAAFSLLALALTGCAARKYRAAPISPAATAATFEQRSLASPALHDYINKTLRHEPAQWDLATLTLAAWHFNPSMEIARARVAAAEAATVTAGARPNPTVTQTLQRIPEIKSIAQRVGRAELSEDTGGTHSSEFEIGLSPKLSGKQTDAVLNRIRSAVEQYPGASFAVNTFLAERIDETLSGYRAGVVVSVFGNDLDALDVAARDVAAALQHVRGAADVQIQSPPGMPQAEIRLRPADVVRWGFSPVTVLDDIRTAFGGEDVGQVYGAGQVIPVSVILQPESRHSVVKISMRHYQFLCKAPVYLSATAQVGHGSISRHGCSAYVRQHSGRSHQRAAAAAFPGATIHSRALSVLAWEDMLQGPPNFLPLPDSASLRRNVRDNAIAQVF